MATIDGGRSEGDASVGTPDPGKDGGARDDTPPLEDSGTGGVHQRDAQADQSTPVPTPAPNDGDASNRWASVALPPLDAATVAHVRAVRARSMGLRAEVFAKCGDSITASANFLVQIGAGAYNLGAFAALEPTIAAHRAALLSDGTNSFTRSSACAVGGWTTANVLAPPSAVGRELDALAPATLIVMFGTNDSQQMGISEFLANLEKIVDLAEARGTVVVLSTIPPRTDYPSADALIVSVNDAIYGLSAARHLPLIDLYAGLSPLPSRGIGADGVHPTFEVANGAPASGDFTITGLHYGYNVRNLTAIQMLDRLCAIP